jgi:two-component sensor histidine kinase
VTAASLLRYALNWVDDDRLPFAVYYPAILVVTLLGGVGPGGFAATLSVIFMWLASVPNFGWPARNQAIYLVVHATASVLTVWLAEGYRRIVRRLRDEEEQRAFLMRELQHRGRNIAAVVRAIVSMTLRESKEDAAKINKAIEAVLAADELLMRSSDHTADLKDILAAELKPYDAARIAANGESIMLVPSLSRAIALILHELATNAAKYGALSKPEGRLSVSWVAGAGRIQIRWVEEGGPTVAPPVRHGFGSHLIERLLNGLHGSVETDFRPGGLVCEISVGLPESRV